MGKKGTMLESKELVKIWINETVQCFIMISVIHYLKPSITFDMSTVVMYTIYMGLVFTVLRVYNRDYYDKATSGMFYSLGNSCF